MNIVLQNPYRTLGLLVGESATKLNRHRTRIPNYLIAGNDIPIEFTEYSFEALGNLDRTIESLTDAASKINLDTDKMNAALFWFYKGNSISDEPSFEALKEGDIDQAINIWSKLTSNKEVTQRNASAYNNLSTLYLSFINNSGNSYLIKQKLENAITLKLKLLESEFIKDFKALATDETFKITNKQLQLNFLNALFSEIEKNDSIEVQEFIDIVNKEEFTSKDEFLSMLIQKPIQQIEKEIEIAEKERKSNKTNGIDIGKKLIKQVENNYQLLQSFLSINNLKFISISDKIADEILNCGIGYFNYYIESEFIYPGVETLDLCKQAEKYALGNVVKLRYKENVEIVGESVMRRSATKNNITHRTGGEFDKFNFAENAWWIFGIAGFFLGASSGVGWALLATIIGAGIGYKIKDN